MALDESIGEATVFVLGHAAASWFALLHCFWSRRDEGRGGSCPHGLSR
jgi:hypothetical protein